MKPPKTRSITVGFCDQYITINSYGTEADKLIDFLCLDLQKGADRFARAKYDLVATGTEATFSLFYEEEELYSGNCRYTLAYTLINEILHHCIVDNDKGNVIHAAAVGNANYGVLLPGTSGSGKSTFTTWLVSCGCNYLTDELVVLLDKDCRIVPFTRPLSIKTGSVKVLSSFLDIDSKEVVTGNSGLMIPHRMVNSSFSANTPLLSVILFPVYTAGAETQLTRLSAAFGCARLIECYVNARNFKGHGIAHLARLSRSTPIYQLCYSNFVGLQDVLSSSFPEMF